MDNSGPCVVDTVFCSPSDLGLSPTIVTELITASSEGLLSLPPFPTALGCFLLPQLNYGYQSLVEGSDNRGPKLKRCLRHGDGPRGTRGWVLAPGVQLLGALGALLSRRVPPSVCVFRYHARIRSAPPPKEQGPFHCDAQSMLVGEARWEEHRTDTRHTDHTTREAGFVRRCVDERVE